MIDYEKRIEEMKEQLDNAKNDADETHSIAPNTYGAGFEVGIYEGLREAYCIITGQEYEL